MATDLTVCNSALAKLGAEPITLITDSNKRAKLCNQQLPIIRQRVLRESLWNFAIKRVALVDAGTTPAFGFSNEFTLPSDYIKIIEVEPAIPYTMEDGKLLADTDAISVRYLYDAPTTKFDSSAAEALAFELAKDLSYAMTQSADFKEQLKDDAKLQTGISRSMDAQEGTPMEFTNNEFVTVRL